MIYLYAVIDDPSLSVEGWRGLAEAPIASIAQGPLAAVCSVHATLDVDPDSDSLWQHEHVTAALMTRCAVAPVRFGTVLADVNQVREMLTAHGPRLAEVLDRLRGKVELAVRASAPVAPVNHSTVLVPTTTRSADGNSGRDGDKVAGAPDRSGRAYLRSRREADPLRPTAALLDPLSHLHTALAAGAVDSSVKTGENGSMVAAYLVDADDVATFRRAVLTARAGAPGLRLSLTGPWAPYSFIEDRARADV